KRWRQSSLAHSMLVDCAPCGPTTKPLLRHFGQRPRLMMSSSSSLSCSISASSPEQVERHPLDGAEIVGALVDTRPQPGQLARSPRCRDQVFREERGALFVEARHHQYLVALAFGAVGGQHEIVI